MTFINSIKYLIIFFITIICLSLISCNYSDKKNNTNNNDSAWQRTGPGGGGSTFIPTFSYNNADNFFVRCDMTGSYLTKNGGKFFQQINFDNGANCYAYDPIDSNIIYTGSAFLNKSEDGGKTWKQIFPNQHDIKSEEYIGDHAEYKIQTTTNSLYINKIGRIENIKVDPLKNSTLYFTMGSSFFYSVNNAETFASIDFHQHINTLYTNNKTAKNEVYIFCTDTIFIFNKITKAIIKKKLPEEMSPAVSFTAGLIKNSDQTIFMRSIMKL